MDIFLNVVLFVHVVLAIAIIVLVLLQHGKGADMGAAFGSGSSGSLFGATGSANFLSRATGFLAALFFLTSLGLTYLASQRHMGTSTGVMDAVKTAPEVPGAAKGDKPPAANDVPAGVTSKPAAESGSKGSEVPK